jgi:fibro-slime domain-containing protein
MLSAPVRAYTLFASVCLLVAGAGCAGTKGKPSPTGQGGNGPFTGLGGGIGPLGDGGLPPFDSGPIHRPDGADEACGDGILQTQFLETCDDGNKFPDDGCDPLCQKSDLYDCPEPGHPCIKTAKCGDGKLTSDEQCDDGNGTGNDGCTNCQVDVGWECRVPGRKCIPTCGDGMIKGGEKCDDSNKDNDDGCSSSCLPEPGATCPPTGGKCTVAVCGNGVKESSEGCDCGTDPAKLPTGCAGPNGLFLGDGTGCSKTCTKEPKCRDSSGKTQACDTTCGNGNKEMGEDCDDGNLDKGDGCDGSCKVEGGFTCTDNPKDDAQDCATGGGKCLTIPVVFRDFKNESVSGGHPDFFYLGATITGGPMISGVIGQTGAIAYNKRYCVTNSGGPAKKNDSVGRCWDLAQTNLAANGKPQFNTTRNGGGANAFQCDCQFIDWSHNGNGGHVPTAVATQSPTYGMPTYVDGAQGHPMYRGPAPIVKDAASFGQWFVDSTFTNNTHSIGTLELRETTTNQFQFTSLAHAVYGGFFPVDPPGQFPIAGSMAGPGTVRMVGTEAMLCNLWPYWIPSAFPSCKGDQYLFPPSITTLAGDWAVQIQGWYHNFWYTTEARYLFTFTGEPFALQFYGDDDLFIFINGRLAVDLGGVHQRLPGKVSVGADGKATIIEGGSVDAAGNINPCPTADPVTMLVPNVQTNVDGNGHLNCTNNTCDCRTRPNVDLGLTAGRTYEIAVFHADRHPTESNYQLTFNGFKTNQSNCSARCGDGVATGAEECDCGETTASSAPECAGHNNDGSYGGCAADCTYGPYCGDGHPDTEAGEECDLGTKNNTGGYGMNGCTPGCKRSHYCGDGSTDPSEQCDLGEGVNGTDGVRCRKDCTFIVD